MPYGEASDAKASAAAVVAAADAGSLSTATVGDDLCTTAAGGTTFSANFSGANGIRWRRGDVLGQGAFGLVCLGLNVETGELMAVKELGYSIRIDPRGSGASGGNASGGVRGGVSTAGGISDEAFGIGDGGNYIRRRSIACARSNSSSSNSNNKNSSNNDSNGGSGRGSGRGWASAATVEHEVSVLRELNHPNIVRYLGTQRSSSTGTVCIFMEYVPGGSVRQLLDRFGAFDEQVYFILFSFFC
jgi:serine/threonine protein kinase